jgi:hypothetical protein
MRPGALTSIALLFVGNVASAQGVEAAVSRGTPIRIAGKANGTDVGVALRVTPDSVVYVSDGFRDTASVAWRDVTRLSISAGRSGTAGAVRGAIGGTGLGFGLALAVFGPGCKRLDGAKRTADDNMMQLGLITTTALTVGFVGAGIGRLLGVERWHPVVLGTSVSVSVLTRCRLCGQR